MEFIKPKKIQGRKVNWIVSEHTRAIVKYYAQYALTILRTFYNFCLPYNSWDKVKAIPAQRWGLPINNLR